MVEGIGAVAATARRQGVAIVCAATAALFVFFARAAAAPLPGTIRVLLATGPAITAGAPGGCSVVDGDGREVAVAAPGAEIAFRAGAGGVSAAIVSAATGGPAPGVTASTGGKRLVSTRFTLVPGAAGAAGATRARSFAVNGVAYRGELRIIQAPDGKLMAVNALSLEEYLYGVVACEMPPGWPVEALKSQAVAARSFAVSTCRSAGAAGGPYDLLATADGQIYGGLAREDPRTNAAVDATRGQVLTYSGEPIRAVFHSSSGGHTENSEFVWSLVVPYLRGVSDIDDDSPHRGWEYRAAAGDIEAAFKAAGYDLGRFLGVKGAERGVSGRWSRLVVAGENGQLEVRGTELRSILGLKSTLFAVTEETAAIERVVSRLEGGQAFTINGAGEVRPARRESLGSGSVIAFRVIPGAYVFRGDGYGHGVGLSQWGARAMAERGCKYAEILGHYYSGARLESCGEGAGD